MKFLGGLIALTLLALGSHASAQSANAPCFKNVTNFANDICGAFGGTDGNSQRYRLNVQGGVELNGIIKRLMDAEISATGEVAGESYENFLREDLPKEFSSIRDCRIEIASQFFDKICPSNDSSSGSNSRVTCNEITPLRIDSAIRSQQNKTVERLCYEKICRGNEDTAACQLDRTKSRDVAYFESARDVNSAAIPESHRDFISLALRRESVSGCFRYFALEIESTSKRFDGSWFCGATPQNDQEGIQFFRIPLMN